MKRIMTPLTMMGADIRSIKDNGCAPLMIQGKPLHAIHYDSPVASAQVKSCVLLAGMYADDGVTSVTEPFLIPKPYRDYAELFWCRSYTPKALLLLYFRSLFLKARAVKVPGDISSAAYFIAAGLLTPGQRDSAEKCRNQSNQSTDC